MHQRCDIEAEQMLRQHVEAGGPWRIAVQLARLDRLQPGFQPDHAERHEQERQINPSLNAQGGRIEFLSGDMLSPEHGWFDHVVCMDSLIHYDTPDIARAFEALAQRTRRSVLFTFAPHTPLLATAHALGRWFPRSDRSPQLSPVRQSALHQHIVQAVQGQGWQPQRMQRIASGFYTSQAWEWVKP